MQIRDAQISNEDDGRAYCPRCMRYYGMTRECLVERSQEGDWTCSRCREGETPEMRQLDLDFRSALERDR